MTLAGGIIAATLLFLCSSTVHGSSDKSSLTSQLSADSGSVSLRFTRQTSNTNSGGSQALSLLDLPVFSRGDRPNYMDKTLGAIFSKVAFAQPPNQTSSTANPKNEVLDPVDEVPQPAVTTSKPSVTTTAAVDPTTQKSSVFEFDTRVFDFVPFERLDPNNTPGLRGPTRLNASKTSDPSGVFRVRTSSQAPVSPPVTTPTTTTAATTTPAEPTEEEPTDSLPTTTPKAVSPATTPARETSSSAWGNREIAWGVQVYGSSSLFLVLGVFVLTCLCRLRSSSRKLLSTSHCLSIHLLVLFLSITRSIHLLYDPYNHRRLLPPALAFSIFNVAFPCLSSALAVLLLGIFRATKLQALPSILVKPPIWAFLVAFHFALSLSIDIVVGSVGGLYTLHLASQAYFVLWSLALSLGFFAAYGPASRAATALQTESLRATLTAMHIHGSSLPRRLPRPTLLKAVRVTLAASVFTVLVSAFQLYGMFGVYGLPWRQQTHPSSVRTYVATQPILTQELLARYKNLNVDALKEALGLNHTHEMKSHDKHREVWPVASEHFWPWWTYQFIARILEFLVAILVAYAASQPQRTQEVVNTDVNKPRSMWIFAGRSFKSSSMETLSSLCCQTNKLMRTREVNQDASPVKTSSDIPVRGFIYANPPPAEGSCVPVPVEYTSNGTLSGSIYGSRRTQRRGPACEVSARHVYQELEQKNSIPSMSYYSTSSMASSTQYYEPSANQLRYDMQVPNAQLLTMLSKESRVYHPNVYGNRHLEHHLDDNHQDRAEEVNQDVYLSQCASTCSSESAGNSFDLRFFPTRTSPKRSSASTMRSSLRVMEPAVYPMNPNFHRSLPPGSRNFRERSPDTDHARELTV